MLTPDDDPSEAVLVPLDDVIWPVVVCQRELGATVHWEPSGSKALGRPDDIAEIVNILLTNARLHAAGTPVEVLVAEAEDCVQVTVADKGPGVPSDAAEQIFERERRSSRSPGQGLGLNIARRIVATQGGRLELLATSAAGAQFMLTLPSGNA